MFTRFSKTMDKPMASLHALAIFFVLADRWLKVWVLATKPVSANLTALTYSLNSGLAFSLPLGQPLILVIVGLIIMWLGRYYFKLRRARDWRSGLIFALLLGSLSNLVDRLLYGGVIDYLNFGSLTVFNLADALIVFSLGLWLVRELLYGNRPPAAGSPQNKL